MICPHRLASNSVPENQQTDGNTFIAIGISNQLGTLKPLWLCAILTAIISSLDTFIFACASAICLRKGDTHSYDTKMIRYTMLTLSLLAVAITLVIRHVTLITYGFLAVTSILAIIVFIQIRKTINTNR